MSVAICQTRREGFYYQAVHILLHIKLADRRLVTLFKVYKRSGKSGEPGESGGEVMIET